LIEHPRPDLVIRGGQVPRQHGDVVKRMASRSMRVGPRDVEPRGTAHSIVGFFASVSLSVVAGVAVSISSAFGTRQSDGATVLFGVLAVVAAALAAVVSVFLSLTARLRLPRSRSHDDEIVDTELREAREGLTDVWTRVDRLTLSEHHRSSDGK
jgi:hypothetical protein